MEGVIIFLARILTLKAGGPKGGEQVFAAAS